MSRITGLIVAIAFALGLTPALAQVQKKEQVHQGTAEQETVQKKAQKKDRTKDASKKKVDGK